MKTGESVVYATTFSYVAAAAASLLGYPAMEGIHPILQALCYGSAALALNYARAHPENRDLRMALAALYGGLAMASYSGIQKWTSYAIADGVLGPAMSLWDLTLAVALLEE